MIYPEKVSIEEFYDDTIDYSETDEDGCSCGCQACQGTGWYRFGHSYKRCCEPCPIHNRNNE